MAGPKADWFVGALDVDELGIPDPFDAPVEEVGELIDLSDRRAILKSRVSELLVREEALYNRQVVCEIKDDADTCCSACPLSKAKDSKSQLGSLCRIGREQEEVATELVALRLIERAPS